MTGHLPAPARVLATSLATALLIGACSSASSPHAIAPASSAEPTGLHIHGILERGGLTGTIDIYETSTGARREETTLGPLHEVHVFDGAHGWLVDRTGEVRRLAGFELDDQRDLAYLGSLGTRPHGSGVVTAPGSRRPETVTLDPRTQLVATRTRRDGEKQRTMTYTHWRAVGTATYPFDVVDTTGAANDTTAIHVQSIEPWRVDPHVFERPADRAPDMTLASDPVTVPIDVVYGGLIFVSVTVNGTPMSFVLDSGAESTVLNASRLPRLQLTGVGAFAVGAGGGDVVASYVPHVTFQVGGATVADQIVAAIPLDDLEKPLQRTLDGILGYDFISRFVVAIDYQGKTLTLRDRAHYQHAAGSPVPITLEDSTPFVDATVVVNTEITGHFTLDTGCLCEVQLFGPFVDEHQLLAALPDAKQAGFSAGAGGQTHQLTTTIPALRIGSAVIEKPQADLSRDTTGATADPESAGLIGSIIWRRFVLVLDYRREQVWLDPR